MPTLAHQHLAHSFDILVIGAGPIGLVTALFAARKGLALGARVGLVAKDEGTGPRAGGMIGAACELMGEMRATGAGAHRHPLRAALQSGGQQWPQLAASLGLDCVGPTHFLIQGDDEILLAQACDALDMDLPIDCGQVAGRTLLRIDGEMAFDPVIARARLLLEFQRLGGQCIEDTIVSIDAGMAQGGHENGAQTYAAPNIVVATGHSNIAPKLAVDLALNVPDIVPVKGMLMRLGGVLRHDIIRTRHAGFNLYAVRRGTHTILGATAQKGQADTAINTPLLRDLHAAASAAIPDLAALPVLESWAGLRPLIEGGLPCVQRSADGSVIWLNGAYRHGWLLAPYMAEMALEKT